ncbi:MAG: prenyltransferase/squalene oxidase repeat-containing protein [Thermoguttaceae bacterium]
MKQFNLLNQFSVVIFLFILFFDLASTPNLIFCDEIQSSIDKATNYLRSTQAPSGAWIEPKVGTTPTADVGPTAVILTGLLRSGASLDDEMIVKSLAYLKHSACEDGGVYTKDGFFQNYETCLAILAFTTANTLFQNANPGQIGPYNELLTKAQKYITNEQFTEEKGVKPDEPFYGGTGYGRHQRPDLSNTQFFIEALRAAGKSEDDPAIQKALVFVSRCQNRESEHNTLSFASKNPDGGFVYSAATQESMAGETPDGGLRSYASMTYAGLKSMIYAGVTKEDKRVQAAFDWITKHYSLDENPGVGQEGLFYYYQVMSKALSVMDIKQIKTESGITHDWRKELATKLIENQRENGSWINTGSKRWMEDNADLVTGYVLMVLSECRK